MNWVLNEESFDKKINQILKQEKSQVEIYNEIIFYCKELLEFYREKVKKEGFKNEKDEILFFKKFKQLPLKTILFYSELLGIEINNSHSLSELDIKIMKSKIYLYNIFLKKHTQFLHHFLLKNSEFDLLYFTRKNQNYSAMSDHMLCLSERNFTTAFDIILAKITAYKKLIKYFELRLSDKYSDKSVNLPQLKWTASKVALTELIYALHLTSVFNQGNTKLSEIVKTFEYFTNVDLGDYTHTFLRLRSRTENTKFLDNLKNNIKKRIIQLDD